MVVWGEGEGCEFPSKVGKTVIYFQRSYRLQLTMIFLCHTQ